MAFTAYTISHIAVGASSVIDMVNTHGIDQGITNLVEGGSGRPQKTLVATAEMTPVFTVETKAIASALAITGVAGVRITSGNTLSFWLQKCQAGGTRVSASEHVKCVINEGILVPARINARQGAAATLTLTCYAVTDGTNGPTVYTGSQAYTAPSVSSEVFTIGPAKINGTEVFGVKSLDINFGLNVKTDRGSGSVYPQLVYIVDINPTISFSSTDLAALVTFNSASSPTGAAQGATDSVVYLRKMEHDAATYSDASTQHLSFTIDDGKIYCTGFSGSDTGDTMSNIMIQTAFDGTNAPIVVAAGVAIS